MNGERTSQYVGIIPQNVGQTYCVRSYTSQTTEIQDLWPNQSSKNVWALFYIIVL